MKRFYLVGFALLMAFDTLAQISFKFAGEHALPLEFGAAWLMRVFSQGWIYGALVGYVGAFFTWMTLLKRAPIGPAFAASHLEIITVLLLSVWLFGERIGTPQVVGGLMILAGIVCLAISETADAAPLDLEPDTRGPGPAVPVSGRAPMAKWHRRDRYAEVPPTAGLPLQAGDLLPWGDPGLEAALAKFLEVEEVQLTCSGTAALVLALEALRLLAPGRDEVVVPAYTCPLVALAVANRGLRLRTCDLRKDSTDLDLDQLQRLCGSRTLAVIPTHLCGRVTDVAGPAAIARACGAWVVEDAAQALGARIGPTSVGLQGDIGFFSLAAGKGLTLYEGGLLVSRDPHLRALMRSLGTALTPARMGWELRRSIELLAFTALYRPRAMHWAYGVPLRRALAAGDWVEAAGDNFSARIALHSVGSWRRRVGVRALQRLAPFLASGRLRFDLRRGRLAAIPGLQVLGDADIPGADGVRPVLLVLLPHRTARDAVLQALWPAGVGVSLPFARPLNDYPQYAHLLIPGDDAPRARETAGRLLAISNSAWLDDNDFDIAMSVMEKACSSLLAAPAGAAASS